LTAQVEADVGVLAGEPVTPQQFRRAMGQVPTSMAVAAAMLGGRPVGMLIGSFASISLDPLLVGFFGDLHSQTYQALKAADQLAFSILGQQAEPVCNAFRLPADDRFAAIGWTLSRHGNPVVDDAVLAVEGVVERRVSLGDHDLVVVAVRAIRQNSNAAGAPLVYHESRMRRLDPHRSGTSHLAYLDWTL
jgi:3-hydroxy-9,10-secoandrosta-1,3,5(10)-triene-9,17-dione monooxygenase reductase component